MKYSWTGTIFDRESIQVKDVSGSGIANVKDGYITFSQKYGKVMWMNLEFTIKELWFNK